MTKINNSSMKMLNNSLFINHGSLPVLLSVPHDGSLTLINGVSLKKYDLGPRDYWVSEIAKDIVINSQKLSGKSPTLIVQKIHRKAITEEIQKYFEDVCISLLKELVRRHIQNKILHLDLHGFINQPSFGEFDLILGTAHRKSLKGSNIDYLFSKFMGDKGYKVYLPQEIPKSGEKFTAEPEHTLVQKILKANIPNVISMQIEIASRFRRKEGQKEGEKLSQDIANYIRQLHL